MALLFGSSGWEDKVVMGDGWAYGVEFLAQKSFGKTTGWLVIPGQNRTFVQSSGTRIEFWKGFPAKYDGRHMSV